MKHLFTLLLLLCAITASAQNYVVYKVKGSVKWQNKGKLEMVAAKQQLNDDDMVSIGKDAELVLIDKKNQLQCVLKTPGTKKLATLISSSKEGAKKLSAMYLSYMLKQLNGNSSTQSGADDDSYATVTRDLLIADTIRASVIIADTIVSDTTVKKSN